MRTISDILDSQIKMPLDGLKRKGGEMITTSNPTFQMEENENTKKRPQEECYEQKILISNDLEGKKKLTLLVKSCYESLNTYGKSPEQLEATIMLMQMVLGRFSYEDVRKAFGIYLQKSSDMPKPADIVKIIEPPIEERKWCATTFIDIKRRAREGQFITKDEKQYCEGFINARIGSPENDDVVRQLEQQNKQYWLE